MGKRSYGWRVLPQSDIRGGYSVREEDLVIALKMTPRDIHRICGKLKEDRLVKM